MVPILRKEARWQVYRTRRKYGKGPGIEYIEEEELQHP